MTSLIETVVTNKEHKEKILAGCQIQHHHRRAEKCEKKEYLIHPTRTSEDLHKDKLTALMLTRIVI